MPEIWNLSALCRCCHADGKFKNLGFAYVTENGVEMYGAMFQETFNIKLNPPPIDASYAICDECISKLRDGYRFKLQVLDCEQKFRTYCQNEVALTSVKIEHESDTESALEEKPVDVINFNETVIKNDDDDDDNLYNDDHHYSDGNDNCIDDEPKNIAINTAKKSNVKTSRPRGRPKKIKRGRPKKIRDVVETKKNIDVTVPLNNVTVPLNNVTVPLNEVTVPLDAAIKANKRLRRPKKIKQGRPKKISDVAETKKYIEVTVPLNEVTVPLNELNVSLNDNNIKNDSADVKVKVDDEQSKLPKIEHVSQEEHQALPKIENKQYGCNYKGCIKSFAALKSLRRHRRLCHSDVSVSEVETTSETPAFVCNIEGCQQVCSSQTGLSQHKTTHRLKEINDLMRSTSPLSEIIKTESGDLIACKTCGHTFQSNEQLTTHLTKEHGGVLKCPTCKNFYKNKYNLRAHILKMHLKCNNQSFKCEYCEKVYPNKAALKAHENIHTRKRIYICDICNKETVHRTSFINHLKSHYGTLKRYYCDQCGRGCNDASNLRIHIETVHEKLKRFDCHLCGAKFALRRGLKSHLLRHEGKFPGQSKFFVKNGVRYERKCPVCPETFADRLKYRYHMSIHKSDCRKYKCDFCNSQFGTRYSLKRHLVVHSGEKKFSCPLCATQFTQKSMIPRHIRNVHKKRNYEKIKCGVCNKFVNNMEKHMKGHEIKPFACDWCEKRYPAKNALNRHIGVTHMGKGKNECSICGKSYIDISKLRTHMKKKHSVEEPKVEIDNFDAALPAYAIKNNVEIEKT